MVINVKVKIPIRIATIILPIIKINEEEFEEFESSYFISLLYIYVYVEHRI